MLPAVGLLFSGAMSLDKIPPKTLAAPQKTPVASVTQMWTDCPVLYKGETLHLHFTLPHPQFLGVIDPDGHFFYVVFPEENSVGQLKPFVSSDQFETLNTLKIKTTTFKADPYTYGIMENKKVFTKSGTYRFLLGDNLHVDDESAVTVLEVKYNHAARPNIAIAAI
jgi:hypothetical protein